MSAAVIGGCYGNDESSLCYYLHNQVFWRRMFQKDEVIGGRRRRSSRDGSSSSSRRGSSSSSPFSYSNQGSGGSGGSGSSSRDRDSQQLALLGAQWPQDNAIVSLPALCDDASGSGGGADGVVDAASSLSSSSTSTVISPHLKAAFGADLRYFKAIRTEEMLLYGRPRIGNGETLQRALALDAAAEKGGRPNTATASSSSSSAAATLALDDELLDAELASMDALVRSVSDATVATLTVTTEQVACILAEKMNQQQSPDGGDGEGEGEGEGPSSLVGRDDFDEDIYRIMGFGEKRPRSVGGADGAAAFGGGSSLFPLPSSSSLLPPPPPPVPQEVVDRVRALFDDPLAGASSSSFFGSPTAAGPNNGSTATRGGGGSGGSSTSSALRFAPLSERVKLFTNQNGGADDGDGSPLNGSSSTTAASGDDAAREERRRERRLRRLRKHRRISFCDEHPGGELEVVTVAESYFPATRNESSSSRYMGLYGGGW